MAKKLCYICEATQGGVRKHLCELIRVFGKNPDYSVRAILGDRGEPGFKEELAALSAAGDFQFEFIPELRRPIALRRDFAAYAAIKERLRAIKPDIVHTHSSKAGFLGRHAAHHLGITAVYHTPHVFAFQWAGGVKGRAFLGLERQAARFCDKLVCVGESQRDDALKRKVADAQKLIVIRNGVSPLEPVDAATREKVRGLLGLPLDARVAGMVARLAPQKGAGVFVRAAAEVLKKHPDVIFVLVGDGPLENEVRERVRALKLRPENFRMVGHRPDAAMLYPAFDVVVLSSLYEGLPYVLLEAMAWGVPIVATDVLGSRDVVIDGETGFLAHLNDPVHIAERTAILLEDRAFHARCAAAARKRVLEHFSFEAFIDGHRRLYSGGFDSHQV